MSDEQWRDVPGFEGLYQVSDHGRVRSLVRSAGRILRGSPDNHGYIQHGLFSGDGNGPDLRCRAHHLVMAAFVGPQGKAVDIRHLDGNPSNNRLDNLAYGTRSENAKDAVRHGRWRLGEAHRDHRLTAAIVLEIRASQGPTTEIAKRLRVPYGAARRAKLGITWKHVPMPEKNAA